MQGIFLIAALASLPVRNSKAKWRLVALVAVFTVMVLEELVERTGPRSPLSLGLAIEFALAPLIYLFICAFKAEDHAAAKKPWLHFIPFSGAAILLIALTLSGVLPKALATEGGVSLLVISWASVKALFFSVYAVFIVRVLRAPAPRERIRIVSQWIERWFYVICGLIAVIYVNFYLFAAGAPRIPDSDILSGVVLAVANYSLAYFALINRDVLDWKKAQTLHLPENQQMLGKARAYLAHSEAFRDPEFNLGALSRSLLVSESALSKVMRDASIGGGGAFINRFRLDAFKASLEKPENRTKSMLDLALEAGFNSKATFYRIFKNQEGVSPTVYQEKINDRKES